MPWVSLWAHYPYKYNDPSMLYPKQTVAMQMTTTAYLSMHHAYANLACFLPACCCAYCSRSCILTSSASIISLHCASLSSFALNALLCPFPISLVSNARLTIMTPNVRPCAYTRACTNF